MKPLPIRWKFALWTAALVGVVVVVFGAGALLNLYREQVEKVDLELTRVVTHIRSLDPVQAAEAPLNQLMGFEPWLAIAVFDAGLRPQRRTPELPETIATMALENAAATAMPQFATRRWRVRMLRHGANTFVVAHALEEADEVVRDLLLSYAVSVPLVLLVATVGGWWVAGRALRGLRDFTASAESVRADQLHRRLPVPGTADEIQRLAEVLNAMLGRLQTSFEQAQRFAADASHELRTPLTIVAGEVERLLRTPGLPASAEEKLLSLQEEIGRLQRITEQMLLLAKFDAGTAGAHLAPLDLSELVRSACEDAELLAPAREISIATAIAPGIRVCGDELHLRRLALNLLDNAIRYNQPHGTVRCTLAAEGVSARIIFGNSGPGVPAAARAQLFQRFFRGDVARSRGGHGLGLSLCREIAHAHRGEIVLAETSTAQWTEFVVTLPLATG